MTATKHHFPEPLQRFDGLAGAVSPALQKVEAAHASYLKHKALWRILPNSVEAMRVELTYHSNAIEGNSLSLRETQLSIKGHAPTSGKTAEDVYQALDHAFALLFIEELVMSSTMAGMLTEEELLDIHRLVLANTEPFSAGNFRTDRILIKGTRFIPPGSQRFGVLIPKMLELANRAGIHPALQAAELHYNLVAIHPFTDGNGRTARLLMNYHLLLHNYPHAIIEVDKRSEYLSALEEADAGRCERFADFVLRSVEQSIRRLVGED